MAPSTAIRRRLRRDERLARRTDFLAIQTRGRKLWSPHYLVFFRMRSQVPARLGVTVSRKVGGAVVRNQVKRWIRETWRQRLDVKPSADVVVVARPGAQALGFRATSEQLVGLIDRIPR